MIRRDSKLMDGGLGATPGTICGLDYMRDPKLNKGSSFTIEERQTLGIHGLLPPRVKSQEEQAGHSMRNLRRLSDPLNQYMYMVRHSFITSLQLYVILDLEKNCSWVPGCPKLSFY